MRRDCGLRVWASARALYKLIDKRIEAASLNYRLIWSREPNFSLGGLLAVSTREIARPSACPAGLCHRHIDTSTRVRTLPDTPRAARVPPRVVCLASVRRVGTAPPVLKCDLCVACRVLGVACWVSRVAVARGARDGRRGGPPLHN